MDRDAAEQLVRQNVKNKNLIKHMLAAEAVMRRLAKHLSQDEEAWGLAGLLHDLDYDRTYDNPEIHGLISAEMLEELDLDRDIVQAVKAHAGKAPIKSDCDRALYATDPLTGFLVACALMTVERSLASTDVDFAMRRFKEKAFARGANREQMKMCEELGLDLKEFIGHGLEAMRGISDRLEL